MEQENKEFPNQIEQPEQQFQTPETSIVETEEGVIVEQPMTEEEKQEITEQLEGQVEFEPAAPTVQEVKAAAVERAEEKEHIDKAQENLVSKDHSDINSSKEAHDMVEMLNNMMNKS